EEIILPDEIVGDNLFNSEPLASVLKEKLGRKISVKSAGSGKYTHSLLRIANKNVRIMIRLEDDYEKMMTEADALSEFGMDTKKIVHMNKKDRNLLVGLKEIKDLMELKDLPRIVEGFDISNWQQSDATGSMVCFIDGKLSKKNYRSYIIKNTDFQGDFAMMQEVVERRYARLLHEEKILPDLIVIDGGKIQVNAAFEVLKKLNLEKMAVLGLIKKETHKEIDKAVFRDPSNPSNFKEVKFKANTAGYRILQNISSEYHRRAIQHHRKLMTKRLMRSPLENIPGIGEKTKIKLFDQFKTLKKIKNADLKKFKTLLGEKQGKKIYNSIRKYFKNGEK
ncbi:MAG: helix-hairpin-helix domain-containing protein, partial [Promethearchaeota archaeon]